MMDVWGSWKMYLKIAWAIGRRSFMMGAISELSGKKMRFNLQSINPRSVNV